MQETGLLKLQVWSDGVHSTVTCLNAVCILWTELVGLPVERVAELSDAPLLPRKADLPVSHPRYETVTKAAAVCCLTWWSNTLLAICHLKMQDGCEKPLCQLLCTYGKILPAQVVQLDKCQAHWTCEAGCVFSCAVNLMCLHVTGLLGHPY